MRARVNTVSTEARRPVSTNGAESLRPSRLQSLVALGVRNEHAGRNLQREGKHRMSENGPEQPNLSSDLSDTDCVQHLLAELHDDLEGKVARLRILSEIGRGMGPGGTMIFGGQAAYYAWSEARSSFAHGNYVATVLLCQGLVEHLLAAYLHAALLMDDVPARVAFRETLRRCREKDVISDEDVADLEKLMGLRNPLSHFRHVHDDSNLDRRSSATGQHAYDLMRQDAEFAIALAVRILSKSAFRVG